MRELRILSGLHRGATLPLDDETVVIGSDESAGVVLLDPGIETSHASLRETSDGWALSRLDGDVLGADTNVPLQSMDLLPGEFGRIGRVWVTVVDAEVAWSDPPSDPVDIESDDLQGADDGNDATRTDDLAQDRQPAAEDAGAAQVDDMGEASDGNGKDVAGSRSKRKFRFVLPLVICAIVLTAWGTYQLVGDAGGNSPLKPGIVSARGAQPVSAVPVELTQEELRAAFRKRLAEVDLLKSFDLKLKDNAWTMQATLDDDEAARFERTLAAFVNQHKIMFPITAKVGNAEHMLPFKIRQVISGANASVITLDGNRMYVGDEHMGVRLVGIKDSRLTFMGKRKVEVRW